MVSSLLQLYGEGKTPQTTMTDDNRKQVHDALAENKVIPVLSTEHLEGKDDAIEVAKALRRGGSNVIEFVLRSSNALDIVNRSVFDAIRKETGIMWIGVGTATTAHDVQVVKDVGADFAVAANFSWLAIERANDLGLFMIPGVGDYGRMSALILGEERSPISNRTVHEVLGGQGVAILKVHPNGATDLIDVINGTIMNDFQRQQENIQFIDLEPSEAVENGWGLLDIGAFATKDNVIAIGGTFPYVIPDGQGGWRDLIQEKNWDGIAAVTRYAMDVTHGRKPQELPVDVALAAAADCSTAAARISS